MSAKKSLTYITGYFESMTKPELISVEGKPTKKRAVVSIATEDEQRAFFEVRDSAIAKFEKLGIRQGDQIEVGFVFIGVDKSGRYYNNLFINAVDYAK